MNTAFSADVKNDFFGSRFYESWQKGQLCRKLTLSEDHTFKNAIGVFDVGGICNAIDTTLRRLADRQSRTIKFFEVSKGTFF